MAWSVSGRRFYSIPCNIKLFVSLLPLMVLANVILYLLLFSKSRVVVIQLEDISQHLVPAPSSLNFLNTHKNAKSCDPFKMRSFGDLQVPEASVADSVLEAMPDKFGIKPGGVWKPDDCVSLYKVAIIIPYRDRITNLKDFLAYMHPFLMRQSLEYRIVVVEQAAGRPFNRAKLFNIGYREIEKLDSVPCYIFHDVDLIPESPMNIYACTSLARHMSANIDVFQYKVPYDSIIGGALAIRKTQFEEVNGFSNTFFGWGGEDDDFYNRITKDDNKVCRFAPEISSYMMLHHKKQKPSADRFYFLVTGRDRYCTDGLNSLKYSVLKIDQLPLYTRILVNL